MDKYVNESGHSEVLILPGWAIPPELYWNRLTDFSLGTMDVFDFGFFSNDEEPLQHPESMIAEEELAPVLVGHSFGAIEAVRLALANPERVSRLVLFSPFAVCPADIEQMRSALHSDPAQMLGKYFAACAAPEQLAIDLPGDLNIQALEEGLSLLQNTDLRQELSLLSDIPVFVFDGAGDRVIQSAASAEFATLSNAAHHSFGPNAGNLHFLNNPSEAGTLLQEMSGL